MDFFLFFNVLALLQLMAVKSIPILGTKDCSNLKQLQLEIGLLKDLRSPHIVGEN